MFINILDIDECISDICDKNALCIDGINLYTCKCNKGFTGDGTSCTGSLHNNWWSLLKHISTVHMVLLKSDNIYNRQWCIYLWTSPENIAILIDILLNILDINECISNPCNTNARCENFIGLYTCECKEGFSGDGTSCTGNLIRDDE